MRSVGLLMLLLLATGFIYTGCKQAEEVVEKSEQAHEAAKIEFENTMPEKLAPEVWKLVHTEDYKLKWQNWPEKKDIYVNPIAQEAIETKEAEFPIGSIIVREKYSDQENLEQVTIAYRASDNDVNNGWFEADYAPDGQVKKVYEKVFNIRP
ncbi:MAG: hypothetical protein AAF462_01270 [Thermodesulfobacteriota bacterium]